MKKIMILVGAVIVIAVALFAVWSIDALVLWGIGNLILHLFNIEYTWTFWHGFGSAIVIELIRWIFKRN
ncbi:hypothetical protein IJE86_02275 [bacterium]|nr:hypothetical protein [bacterium]